MRVTIVYDNKALIEGLQSDWGLSCLVEAYGKKIPFDTGASGSVLLGNMKKLMIKPSQLTEIFISHAHGDHTGGLSDLLKVNPVKVYIPSSCLQPPGTLEVVKVTRSFKIHENIFSTGVLMNIEQPLLVQTEKGLVVIVGCSHPGVRSIFRAPSQFGKARAPIAGLHGLSDFGLIQDLQIVCPAHCTQYTTEIKSLYPHKYVQAGVGKVTEI